MVVVDVEFAFVWNRCSDAVGDGWTSFADVSSVCLDEWSNLVLCRDVAESDFMDVLVVACEVRGVACALDSGTNENVCCAVVRNWSVGISGVMMVDVAVWSTVI